MFVKLTRSFMCMTEKNRRKDKDVEIFRDYFNFVKNIPCLKL